MNQDHDQEHDRGQEHAELMAAALADDLSTEQRTMFDDLCAADDAFSDEYQALRRLSARLTASPVLSWDDHDVPAGLERRVVAAVDQEHQSRPGSDADVSPLLGSSSPRRTARGSHVPRHSQLSHHRRRLISVSAIAASLLVVGALGGVGIDHLLDLPPKGPPGTLGAVEPIVLTQTPQGARMDAELVAHTWGTETILEIDGLPAGQTYDVVLIREDGQELLSGTFLGTERTVTCRMNAAVLRQDLARVQIRDADGAVIARSDITRI